MQYIAMTLADTAPKPDPHGVNIPFGPIAIVIIVIWVVLRFFPGGRGH